MGAALYSFTSKFCQNFFCVMGMALSGELTCTWTDLVKESTVFCKDCVIAGKQTENLQNCFPL